MPEECDAAEYYDKLRDIKNSIKDEIKKEPTLTPGRRGRPWCSMTAPSRPPISSTTAMYGCRCATWTCQILRQNSYASRLLPAPSLPSPTASAIMAVTSQTTVVSNIAPGYSHAVPGQKTFMTTMSSRTAPRPSPALPSQTTLMTTRSSSITLAS